jgi:DHA1 family bicyclomycin/chloramphenicol resistance-like MFS transporter
MRNESRGFTLFLASMTMLTSVSIDMALPAIPAIERVFGLAEGRGSLVFSVFLASYAVTPLIGGPLSDRFGRRPVFLAAVSLFCVFAFACTWAPTFALLLLFRMLQGCVAGIVVSLPLAIVRDLFSGHAARQRVSEVTLVNGIMPIVAPLFGAAVMLVGSWREISTSQGVFALLLAVFAYFQFRESKTRDKQEAFRLKTIVSNYKEVFSHRVFVTFALIYALNFSCVFAFVSTSPLVLMERMHISRVIYTVMFASTLLGTVLGSSASSAFSRWRISARKTIFRGLIVMTSSSVIALLLQLAKVQSPYAILVPAFVVFFCFGLTSPVVTLEALGPFPRLAGSGSGAIRALQMALGSLASSGLAYVCAFPRVMPGVATTLTMATTTAIGLLLFVPFRKAGLMNSQPDAGPPIMEAGGFGH